MRRKWAERIVIAIAVVASIATSPKRWTVDAALPPPVPGKPMIVTVEASEEPNLWIVGVEGPPRRLDPPSTWPGRGRYFMPAGALLKQVSINGPCSMGLCSSGDCKPPDTAYVRVASATPVDGWIAEARSAPVTTVLDASKPTPSYRVTLEASRLPIALEIEGAPFNLAPKVWSIHLVPTPTFSVDWTASDAQPVPVTVTWTARATIQGECAAAGCAVPAGEAVRIVAVESKAPDEP
jgi:hypothetical protein